ncbi:hypothetical protein GPECTOR_20g559 [Gonium pectorale]|uniref:Uncharacterized protein n=1 Tax=Gonium pectorale TaxID=33097 RepID=A0A150GIR6_GONPE|nr:hypothetical protein GPECTOR_20g559 [Gonium pectorale]|eukprot:KXZ49702.1 hypothetical protein GPECTOR_20g559 [Gonium pectorale]
MAAMETELESLRAERVLSQRFRITADTAITQLHAEVQHYKALNGRIMDAVRRAAMRLLSLVVLPAGGGAAPRLASVLLAKLRDKDAVVSDRAVELLAQLPFGLVARVLEGGGGGVGSRPVGHHPHQQHPPTAGPPPPPASPAWVALVQHCVSGLAAAAPEARPTAPGEGSEEPAGEGAVAGGGRGGGKGGRGGGGGGGGVSVRAQNCLKLLKSIVGWLATMAEARVGAGSGGGGGGGGLHPLAALLLPAVAGGGPPEPGQVASLRRAAGVAAALAEAEAAVEAGGNN